MRAKKIEFIPEPAKKACDEVDGCIEAGNARLESELRIMEILQFERGYN